MALIAEKQGEIQPTKILTSRDTGSVTPNIYHVHTFCKKTAAKPAIHFFSSGIYFRCISDFSLVDKIGYIRYLCP